MLRPRACCWFELIAPRDQLEPVLEALARAGAVELQTHDRHAAPLVIGGVDAALARFHELARSAHGHWPAPRSAGAARIVDPAATLLRRVAALEAWRADADPLITELEHLAAEARNLADVARLLGAGGAALPDAGLLDASGSFVVDVRIYALGAPEPASSLPAEVMQLGVPAGDGHFVILVGRRAALAALDEGFVARHARRVDWPAALPARAADAAHEVAARQADLDARRAALQGRLDALAERHEVAAALADIGRVEWLIRHGSELEASERLVWVSGWTTAADEERLAAPLRRLGLACVVHFPPPPAGSQAPSVLVNPRWVRGFEAFARLLGQPGTDEADPSLALALIAPLLFGFMFGDVGHGAVMCLAGWLLRRRVPTLLLLVPGGAVAMVFGLLFGAVFTREDLIRPLWMHPLQHPLVLLATAVALGAAILLLGLVLNAVQAFWRHAGRAWWTHDAALAIAYAGVLAAPWQRGALWLVAVGAAWAAVGPALGAGGGRAAALLRGLAQFVEHALQLAVNTVSFARVGAFALAHAGLSAAVVALADASGAVGYWIVLALGNLLILVLEGLVVGIQTTRLLLFEFFLRFLQGHGRAFRPLPPPPVPMTS